MRADIAYFYLQARGGKRNFVWCLRHRLKWQTSPTHTVFDKIRQKNNSTGWGELGSATKQHSRRSFEDGKVRRSSISTLVLCMMRCCRWERRSTPCRTMKDGVSFEVETMEISRRRLSYENPFVASRGHQEPFAFCTVPCLQRTDWDREEDD